MRKTAWAPAKRKLGCPCSKSRDYGLGDLRKNGSNGVADLGLSLMSITSIFSVHASISPSFATFRSFFSKTPEERAIATQTLLLSLGASTVSSLGIYLVFKRWVPAIAAEIAGVGLFALGMYAVHAPAPATPSTMDVRRQEQLDQAALATGAGQPQPQLTTG
jgi:hypothetical protein